MPNAAGNNPSAGVSRRISVEQYNALARQQLIKNSIRKKQIIYSFTGDPATINNTINIGGNFVRMAGLLTRFIVEVSGTFTTLSSGTAAATEIGAPNLLNNVQFTDLQNNQRHNCSGAQLVLTSTIKRHYPWGTSFTEAQKAFNGPATAPALFSVTPPTTTVAGSARCVYEIPVSLSNQDLTGGIFLGVYGAQLSLQLTINPNPCPATGDSTFAVFYGSAATSTLSSVTVNVYQEYYDQLPMNNGAYVLPPLDISTVYQLTYTNFTNLTTGQDYFIPYANYRKYLSQSFIYNNSGTNGGLSADGSDIDYLTLTAANFTNIFKVNPPEQKRLMREQQMTDLFQGLYVFKTYDKPIDTQNYGNLQLAINPNTAGASAYAYVMSEFIAYQNQIAQAPSLPANK